MYDSIELSKNRIDEMTKTCMAQGLISESRRTEGHQVNMYSMTVQGWSAYILLHALLALAPADGGPGKSLDTGDEQLMRALEVIRRRFVGNECAGLADPVMESGEEDGSDRSRHASTAPVAPRHPCVPRIFFKYPLNRGFR